MLNRCVLLDNKDRREDDRRPVLSPRRTSRDRPPVTIADRETGTRSRRRRITAIRSWRRRRSESARVRTHSPLRKRLNGSGLHLLCVYACDGNTCGNNDGYCFRSDGKFRRIVSSVGRRRGSAGRGAHVVAPRRDIIVMCVRHSE